jgi:HTH-type transcriptional regulator / antitoxin HigA
MKIKPIRTEKDYHATLQRLEKIFDAKPAASESDELKTLCILIEKYEDQHHPIENPAPIEAIKFRMEQLG